MDITSENVLKYVFDTFKSNYLNCDFIEINFGTSNNFPISIKNTSGIFFQNKNDWDDSKTVWKYFFDRKIPLLFSESDREEIFTITENKVVINYDIISSAFYFLTCWQEYVSEETDRYGRYQFENSLQKKLEITKIPVVNYYFEILKQAIEHSYKTKLIRKMLPENARFAVCLTHDIDSCNSGWKEDVYWALRNGKLKNVFQILLNKIKGKDTWFTFEKILQTEKDFNATSSFYFLAKKGRPKNITNSDYDLHSVQIQEVLTQIKNSGSEIGIHGSYKTHDDVESYGKDRSLFEKDVIGNRFHYLEFDIQKSQEVLQANGIKYDTTLGFAKSIGFRNSYCHPYYLYDFINACRSEVLEIPLVLMDTTLRKYCKMNQKEVLDSVIPIIDELERFSGVLTVLWHNTSFSDNKYRGWGKIYSDLLTHLLNKNAWLTNASNIYLWYK